MYIQVIFVCYYNSRKYVNSINEHLEIRQLQNFMKGNVLENKEWPLSVARLLESRVQFMHMTCSPLRSNFQE